MHAKVLARSQTINKQKENKHAKNLQSSTTEGSWRVG